MALSSAPRPEPPQLVRLERARNERDAAELERIVECARKADRPSVRVEALSCLARLSRDEHEQHRILTEAAVIARGELHRYDLALELTARARACDPTSIQTLATLAELFELEGRPRDALTILEALAGDVLARRADPSPVARSLCRLARSTVAPRARPDRDIELAVVALRLAVACDPTNAQLREELVRTLSDALDLWPASASAVPPSRTELGAELARLARQKPLADPQTVDLLRRALELREDAGDRESLYRALVCCSRFADLESELSSHAQRAPVTERATRLCVMGQLASRPPWSRPDLAREAYGNALACDPACDEAFEWLIEDAQGDRRRIDRLVNRCLARNEAAGQRNVVRSRVLSVFRHLPDIARVVRTARAMLVDDPNDREALEACSALLRAGDWQEGIVALLGAVDSAAWALDDAEARVALLATCVRIAEQNDAEEELLLLLYERLVRLAPGRPDLVARREQLRSVTGSDARSEALLQGNIERAPSATVRAQSLCQLGQLHLQRYELEPAWTAFQRALSIDPTEPNALEALEELAREPSRSMDLEAVLRRRLVSLEAGRTPWPRLLGLVFSETASSPDASRAMHLEVQRELAELTPDEDEALALLGRCLALDPNDASAADEIARILSNRGETVSLGTHLERRLAHLDPAAGRGTLRRLARLLQDELHEPVAALARWQEVIAEAPDDMEALEARAEIHFSLGQVDDACSVLEHVAEVCAPGPQRSHALRRLARAKNDPAARALAYRRVLAAAPDDPEALAQLAGYYDRHGESAWAIELYERLATCPCAEVSLRLEALSRLTILSEPVRALSAARAALALEPMNLLLIAARERAARRAQDSLDLVDCLERRLFLERDPGERARGAVEIARVWLEELDSKELSARALERAVREPSSASLARVEMTDLDEKLTELYRSIEDWPTLVSALRGRLTGASASDRIDLMVELATVYADKIGELEPAIELYAMAALEAPSRRDIDDALIETMARAGQWDGLVGVLERRAASAANPAERASLHHTCAILLYRAMGRPHAAFDAASRMAREVGPRPELLELVRRTAFESGRMQDLVTLLDELGSHGSDVHAGCASLWLAAEVLEHSLGAPSKALDRYLEILRRTAVDPAAAAHIEQLALASDRVESWVDAELEREKLTPAQDERVRILERVARVLAEVQGERDRALELLLRALSIDESQVRIADALEELSTDIESLTSDPSARRRVARAHMQLAAAGSWHLRRARAILSAIDDPAVFDAARALALAEPDDAEAREALWPLAEQTGRWPELLASYDELASMVKDAYARIAIRLEQARVLSDVLQRQEPARALLQDVFCEAPSWPGLWEKALAVARASGQAAEMAQAIERKLTGFRGPDLICAERLRAGLYASLLDRPELAVEASQAILSMVPRDAYAEGILLNTYGRVGRWEPLAELLWTRACEAQTEASAAAREAAQAAEIWIQRVGDLPRATMALRRAVELSPGDVAALGSLRSVLERTGAWEELAELLARLAATLTGRADRVQALLDRAGVLEGKLGKAVPAIRCLEQAREIDPTAIDAISGLERLYELVGKWTQLKALREEAANLADSPERARSLLLRLAQLCSSHWNDLDSATEALRRAIAATPDYVPSYGHLREVLRQRASYGELVELLVTESSVWTDPSESAARLCEAAQIAADRLGDEDRARKLYREALDVCERCSQAARALADDAERQGDPAAAVGFLEELKHAVFDQDELQRIDRRIERLQMRVTTRVMRRVPKE